MYARLPLVPWLAASERYTLYTSLDSRMNQYRGQD